MTVTIRLHVKMLKRLIKDTVSELILFAMFFSLVMIPTISSASDKKTMKKTSEVGRQEYIMLAQADGADDEDEEDEEDEDEDDDEDEDEDEEEDEDDDEDDEEDEDEDEDEEIEVDCTCVDDELECADDEAEEEAEEYECECDEDGEVVCEGGGEEENVLGNELYDAYCARCHGFDGDGKGDASNFTNPKPRDFTSGMYKFRSTPSGDPPVEDDIIRIILKGVPGTSMFGWEGKFSEEDLDALVEYLMEFEPETFEIETESIEIGDPPPVTDELIKVGIEVFEKAKCWECHGKYGRGDGEKGWQPNFKDDWGDKIWPTNLAHPWELRNGASLADLFRSISTGLDGTPMPSFADSYSAEQRWGLSYYLKSLQVERKFGSTVVMYETGKLPASTDDPLWNEADYIDLQIEGKKVFGIPFVSMITNIRVRGYYTKSQFSIMLEWMDKKPDKGDDGLPPDAISMQLPVVTNLINIWHWQFSDNSVAEYNMSGQQINGMTKQETADVRVQSSYTEGIYRLMFTRNLRTGDSNDAVFRMNKHIPFSITAYDGKNNEKGHRGAMSSVRYLIMKKQRS